MAHVLENIEGIVFDKDGTLFDFSASWCVWCDRLIAELSDGNNQLAANLAHSIGYDNISRTFATGALVIGGAADETANALAEQLPNTSIDTIHKIGNKCLVDLPLVPVTGLDSLLVSFKASGFKLGVATNDSEASAITQLSQCGIKHHFDFICGYDSGFGSKPAAGMIDAFCKATDLHPSKVAMIGDSLHDLHAGKAAGVGLKVGVLTGPALEAELSESADIVLKDISHLL